MVHFSPASVCSSDPPLVCRVLEKVGEALVWRFHAETGTFHLSYGEYAILPLDWTTILGMRFGGLPILTDEMSFEMASELLGIPLPLIADMRGYLGPTASL